MIANDRVPGLNEIAAHVGASPLEAEEVLRSLEEQSAIVLSAGSPNIWLADPFAALPTANPVQAEGHHWFGMCVWDALGILALTSKDGRAPCVCPVSGEELTLEVAADELVRSEGVVHFAVPASSWWEDLAFA